MDFSVLRLATAATGPRLTGPRPDALLKDDGGFDLVITDIVMPGLDGAKLAQHVKDMKPHIPVIAITGGVENATADYAHYADMFSDETLSKPFASMSNVTSIWGTPRGAGTMPPSLNLPRVLLSCAIERSPCRT